LRTSFVHLSHDAPRAFLLSSFLDHSVFAPTNSSFDALPEALLAKLLTDPWKAHLTDILLYHVASGTVEAADLMDGMIITMANLENVTISTTMGVMVNTANVVVADIMASNGIAHVIDAVLTPSFLSTTIVDIALAAATTLAELVVMAELDTVLSTTDGLTVRPTLSSNRPFHALCSDGLSHVLYIFLPQVFAPTNEAFDMVDNATLAFLTSDEGKDTLVGILQYHVVGSVIPYAAIATGETMVPSLQGGMLTVVKDAMGAVTVNGAMVIAADVLASNGIVHVIDEVLLPPATMAPTSAPSSAVTAAVATGMACALAASALM
jgi:uncharacterized surface protein with fasciclin (FAS1) repeats